MMSVQWPSTKCSFIKTSSSSRQRSWTGPRHGTHPGPLSTHTKFSLEEMVLQKDSLNQNNHFDNKVHKSQKHAGYSCKKHRQHKHSDKWKLHHMADFRFCWKEWDPASFNLCSQEKKKKAKISTTTNTQIHLWQKHQAANHTINWIQMLWNQTRKVANREKYGII